jgi:exopolysaccharide biosynthesis polyprenyl glycosylphosphotransferase
MSASIAVEELYNALDPRTADLLRRRGTSSVRRRGWLVRRALLGADLLGLSVAFIVAELAYPVQMNSAGKLSELAEYALLGLCLPAWAVLAKCYGLYDNDEERADHSTTDDFARVFHLVTVGSWLLYASSLGTNWFNPQFGKIFVFWLVAVAGVPLMRSGARSICRRQIDYLQNTIIVGAGDVGQTIARKLLKHPEYGINLVGFVDADPRERIPGLEHLTLLGMQEDLPELIDLLDVERVIVAFSSDRHEEQLDMIRNLNALSVQVVIVPRFFDVLNGSVVIHAIEGLPVCSLPPVRLSRSTRFIKRLVDVAGAGIGLIVLSPAFVIIAITIKLDSSGPVLFRQVRMGEHRRAFSMLKFRSMTPDAEARKREFLQMNKHLQPGGDARMFKIDDDPRVTRAGSWLRRWSLDELPQLINVLRGEMSLVGPRPLILDEDRYVDDWAVRRLDLRPGITGLWQVLGRDNIGFDEMVRLDYQYVTGWSLGGDIRLLLRTLPLLVARAATQHTAAEATADAASSG